MLELLRNEILWAPCWSPSADVAGATASPNVFTGSEQPGRRLLDPLLRSIASARQIDINVAFLMESGLNLILEPLKAAAGRGATIRILTGDYLGITIPAALYKLRSELGDAVDLRLFPSNGRSYHPKAYIFRYRDPKKDEIFVGSSNLSRSALTGGIEWNYRLRRTQDTDGFDTFSATFDDLFNNHAVPLDDEELRRYASTWHKPAVLKELERFSPDADSPGGQLVPMVQPRGAQVEALYALQKTRDDGAERALVQAATGIGKTYLAAFDSRPYGRVLFVAHRKEILDQAANTFRTVRPKDTVGFFDGSTKDKTADIICASVATLGQERYLTETCFAPDRFDYIVVDEFHHAVSSQYRRICDYFRPQFLLGLTATPERLDQRDIYELCDYNVAYELNLQQAINRGSLVPFHYYGIYDPTDYSNVQRENGRYNSKALAQVYAASAERDDLIFQHYQAHPSKRALGFCCSVQHAAYMAETFRAKGVRAVSVCSKPVGEYSMDRETAVRQLLQGKVDVIFSVDMFNEGVDIPALDMVMFLRPTESPVVFLQQLGRGLRTYHNKKYVTVLDFIGNYIKADRVQTLLGTRRPAAGSGGSRVPDPDPVEYPDDCMVHFDLKTVELFKRLERARQSVKQRIDGAYDEAKERLHGKVPTRMDLFELMDDDVYRLCFCGRARLNPFKQYLDYLHERGDLTETEQALYDSVGKDFLSIVENTLMTKVYKMPVLYAFVNDGRPVLKVSDEQLLGSWKSFFGTGSNWRDLGVASYADYLILDDEWHLGKMQEMPIKHLLKSGDGFFVETSDAKIALREDLAPLLSNEAFVAHLSDIIEYRKNDYYRRRYRDRTERLTAPTT